MNTWEHSHLRVTTYYKVLHVPQRCYINLPDIKVNSNSIACITQCKRLYPTPIAVGMNKKPAVCKIQKVLHQSWSTCSDWNEC